MTTHQPHVEFDAAHRPDIDDDGRGALPRHDVADPVTHHRAIPGRHRTPSDVVDEIGPHQHQQFIHGPESGAPIRPDRHETRPGAPQPVENVELWKTPRVRPLG
jgi:hypothetical protein